MPHVPTLENCTGLWSLSGVGSRLEPGFGMPGRYCPRSGECPTEGLRDTGGEGEADSSMADGAAREKY